METRQRLESFAEWSPPQRGVAAEGTSPATPPSGDPDLITRHDRGPIRTVMLATDLGPASETATTQAVDLAARLGAALLVVNVIDSTRRSGERNSRVDQQRGDREPLLLKIVDVARRRGVAASFLIWTGEPGSSVVAAAEAESVDMIVVGTRRVDSASRIVLGSVSDHVVHYARCPVLVTR